MFEKIFSRKKNPIETFFDSKKKLYIKFSIKKKFFFKIKKEKEGIKWFNKLMKKKSSIYKFIINKSLALIVTKKINGKKNKTWSNYKRNSKEILNLISFYEKKWPKSKITYSHGDLTFDNILMNNNNINIIDWEFFGKRLYGYDLVYFFLSAVCINNKNNYDKSFDVFFIKCWKKFIKLKINSQILDNPFNYYKKNIKKELVFKYDRLKYKDKFFVFYLNKKIKKKIMQLIHEIKKEK